MASCLPCQLDPWIGFFRTPRSLSQFRPSSRYVQSRFWWISSRFIQRLWKMEWLRAYLDMILLFILTHLFRSRHQLIVWTSFVRFISHINHRASTHLFSVEHMAKGFSRTPILCCSSNSPSFEIRPMWTRPDEFLHHFAPTTTKGEFKDISNHGYRDNQDHALTLSRT